MKKGSTYCLRLKKNYFRVKQYENNNKGNILALYKINGKD